MMAFCDIGCRIGPFPPVKIFYDRNSILLNLLNFMPEHKVCIIIAT